MPLVGPIPDTHVPSVYDTDSHGFGGPADMNGPEIGMFAYSEPGDNLHVQINIQFGQPSTSYEVFLVAGPAHAMAHGYVAIGTLLTDAVGQGSGAFTVPHATLLAAPFGPGYRTDHIDLLKGVGDLSGGLLTAGAINYFVCREKDQPGPAGLAAPHAQRAAVGAGDPHGAARSGTDPAGGKKP